MQTRTDQVRIQADNHAASVPQKMIGPHAARSAGIIRMEPPS